MGGPDALLSGYCETLAWRELMHTGKVRRSVQDVGGAVKHCSCHKSLGTQHGDSCGMSEKQVLGHVQGVSLFNRGIHSSP